MSFVEAEEFVDHILKEDDLNRDGKINYKEFVSGSQ